MKIFSSTAVQIEERPAPCTPSPCGANAVCREQNGAGSCACLPEYVGNPYEGCRPECILNTDCPSSKACIRNKCRDPCPGTCGSNAECQVIGHLPNCLCRIGFTGDPFAYCTPIPPERKSFHRSITPVVTSVSPFELSFTFFYLPPAVLAEPPLNPCAPSPCGPNSQCRETNGQAVCSCLAGFAGIPPECRPECVLNSECPSNKACIDQKCKDPCESNCGKNARCRVHNHSPICYCLSEDTGDPFVACYPVPRKKFRPQFRCTSGKATSLELTFLLLLSAPPSVAVSDAPVNPCVPSPCGPYSECRPTGGVPSCSCRQGYIGAPPNCRPECITNYECPSDQACVRQKCADPCPGSCGQNAACQVFAHVPSCVCIEGYAGDPFSYCNPKPQSKIAFATTTNFRTRTIEYLRSPDNFAFVSSRTDSGQ